MICNNLLHNFIDRVTLLLGYSKVIILFFLRTFLFLFITLLKN
ncbi:hypothetical protein HMPREF0669_02005 (plasmid) [Prevotella sp. oral taxon 299 str. F0039]|nr:hypothetical protein HMPREF0669_02005 [Prevotella sp. oral taxon 299 str. F0039]